MTGGRAVILGPTGRNFGAGMSGGVAYVWNVEKDFSTRVNMGMVVLEDLAEEEDVQTVLDLVRMHRDFTGSPVASHILDTWKERRKEFVKVVAPAYKRVLELQRTGHTERLMEVVNG